MAAAPALRKELMRRLLHYATLIGAVVLALGVHDPAATAQTSEATIPARLPAQLDGYIRSIARFTPAQIKSLLGGSAVVKLLDTPTADEVAVFGAVWINAPLGRYVDAVKDIETFERGPKFLVTKRISDPPRLEDFARLVLPDDDVKDLRTCRIGDCEVQLSQSELEELHREIDWSKPTSRADVNVFMRRRAYEFVTGYLEGGNERLSVYRDSKRPTFVSAEFKSMIDRLPEFVDFLPGLQRYLLEYPKGSLPGDNSFLYWQTVDFGLKPTIRINHVVIRPGEKGAAVAIKMLYASHYFWTALDLRVLMPDPARGPGFWFVSLARSRSDGLTGFTGWLIRNRVRREARNGALEALRGTKTRLEK